MKRITLLACLVSPLFLVGCDSNSAEEAGEAVDEAIDEAGDALEDAADSVEDAAD